VADDEEHHSRNPAARGAALSLKRRSALYSERDAKAFSSHSLRHGLCAAAAEAGASIQAIMSVSGHRSVATVEKYCRQANRDALSPHKLPGVGQCTPRLLDICPDARPTLRSIKAYGDVGRYFEHDGSGAKYVTQPVEGDPFAEPVARPKPDAVIDAEYREDVRQHLVARLFIAGYWFGALTAIGILVAGSLCAFAMTFCGRRTHYNRFGFWVRRAF
jgi:hypothetical protein